jgi:hypothetical protein
MITFTGGYLPPSGGLASGFLDFTSSMTSTTCITTAAITMVITVAVMTVIALRL